MSAVRVVSLNLWKNEGDFPSRLALVRNGLAALAPDVVCLQECFACTELGLDAAAFLADGLGMALMAAPARGKRRSMDGASAWSTSGLAILASAPAPFFSLDLPSDPRDGERIAQLMSIDDGLVVLNLHLTHLAGADGAALRARQLHTALERASACAPAGAAMLVCGDLNASADAPELAPLFARGDLDPGPDARAARTWSTLHGAPDAPAIDHVVLIGGGKRRIVRVARALAPVDGVWPSDHAALVADLSD